MNRTPDRVHHVRPGAVRPTDGWLEKLGDQPGPTRLMRRADAAPAVTVKVLVEQHVVAEVRIVLQTSLIPEHRPLAILVAEEDPGQPHRQLAGDFADGVVAPRSRRALDGEV